MIHSSNTSGGRDDLGAMDGKKGRKRDCKPETSWEIYKIIKERSGKDLTRIAEVKIILVWDLPTAGSKMKIQCKKFL